MTLQEFSLESRQPRSSAWLAHLGSSRLTLWLIGLFALAIVASYFQLLNATWALAVPLALFVVNLGCAVSTNAVFRRQGALFAFHFALIAIVLLIAIGRLTYLRGHIELSSGETFSGKLVQSERGPWHWDRLAQALFVNEGFTIEYSPGMQRDRTANTVSWVEAGTRRSAVIGDLDPLVRQGYRFYTSFNKGFAPLFTWQPAAGAPARGTVHLPSYPINEFTQAREWTPPGTTLKLWTMLDFDETPYDATKAWRFKVPDQHLLIVREGERRWTLKPGAQLVLAQGVLVYEGLTTWMGYKVFYDWTLPWLLAACVVAIGSMAWHFWRKYASGPWDR